MSQTIGKVRLTHSTIPTQLTNQPLDPPRLRTRLAPRLPLILPAHPRPRLQPDSTHPHGQAQADLRPQYRLRRLRRCHRLRAAQSHGQEAPAEDVLYAHDKTRESEEYEFGEIDGEMGRWRGAEEGGEGNAAEE